MAELTFRFNGKEVYEPSYLLVATLIYLDSYQNVSECDITIAESEQTFAGWEETFPPISDRQWTITDLMNEGIRGEFYDSHTFTLQLAQLALRLVDVIEPDNDVVRKDYQELIAHEVKRSKLKDDDGESQRIV